MCLCQANGWDWCTLLLGLSSKASFEIFDVLSVPWPACQVQETQGKTPGPWKMVGGRGLGIWEETEQEHVGLWYEQEINLKRDRSSMLLCGVNMKLTLIVSNHEELGIFWCNRGIYLPWQYAFYLTELPNCGSNCKERDEVPVPGFVQVYSFRCETFEANIKLEISDLTK